MKKAFTLVELLAVIVIIGVLGLITTPIVNKTIQNSKEKAYETQVNLILEGSKKWAIDNSDQLPSIGSSSLTQVNVDMIIKGGYITKTEDGKLYNPKDKSKTMNGCVEITYSAEYNQYIYNYNEDCKMIEKKSLLTLLKGQYSSSNITGLLSDGSNYYYKGTNAEVANNFVWYEGHLWRVIQINSDNTITMVTQQPITAIQPASSVWTTQAAYNSSYINTWLNNVFYNSISDKSKIKQSIFNVGIYNNVSEITSTQYVGLLDIDQYTRAGLANSFLDIKDYFWLGNIYDLYSVGCVYSNGSMSNFNFPVGAIGARPVMKISDLTITSGNGTLSDPFREIKASTNTSNVKVGEYISVPGNSSYCGSDARCLFRVVSKDSNSVKVILNGLLPTTSVFDSSNTTFSASSTINTPLTNFANSISATYRYSGNKAFNIGMYGGGANYTAVSNTTYSGNVGLPVVGEMFSGNDIDVATGAKTFVNGTIIENLTISDYFWTMNAYDSTTVRSASNNGDLPGSYPSFTHGVRPVIYLNLGTNSNLTFTKGEGTAESPFWLGN